MKLASNHVLRSFEIHDSKLNSFQSILNWIDEDNKKTKVHISRVSLEQCSKWAHDKASKTIHNENSSFFSVSGIKYDLHGNEFCHPIIIQNEIGYLGLACTIVDGVLYFLMQAKIEPGNINVVQISPTIQATKSNFMKKHGGALPAYLDLFQGVKPENVIVDQVQSEQGTRFLRKRNRNIIIFVDKDVEVMPTHRWMTLGQIHDLMKIPNLVNMDTRTVLSLLPLSFLDYSRERISSPVLKSIARRADFNQMTMIFHHLNNCKMKGAIEYTLCDPFELRSWEYVDGTLGCTYDFPFDLIFCDIEIEGREVKRWCQPLFRSKGHALFALMCRNKGNSMEYLVSTRQEIGCFDVVELGPTLQIELEQKAVLTQFEKAVYKVMNDKKSIIYDNLLSEEGGRFYHEENRNVIFMCGDDAFDEVPEGYFWCSLSTLNKLCQINNLLNIQLRNLLSLVDL